MSKENKTQAEKFNITVYDFVCICEDILGDLNQNNIINVDLSKLQLVKSLLDVKNPNTDNMSASNNSLFMNQFIEKTHNYWNKISEKDELYFIQNISSIFNGLGGDHMDVLKHIFTGHNVDIDTKNIIWDYIHALIRISIVHIHYSKEPNISQKDGKRLLSWKKTEEYKNIGLTSCAKLYGIDLMNLAMIKLGI